VRHFAKGITDPIGYEVPNSTGNYPEDPRQKLSQENAELIAKLMPLFALEQGDSLAWSRI
jgi:hypothetical protein